MQGRHAVFIRAKDGTLINRINDFVSLNILMTLNDVGSWSMTSVSPEICPFSAGTGIVDVRNGEFLYGGVVTQISDSFNAVTGLHSWQVQGKGDLEYLNRRLCYVDPTTGSTTGRAYYTDSGYLHTVIYNLIQLNTGVDALEARREPIIADYQQSADSPLVSVSLRFQNLLQAVTALAASNGWNVRPNWDNNQKKVYFDIYQGRDLTENIIFTEQLNNIVQAEHLVTIPEGNNILVGGAGVGTTRNFVTVQDDASADEWGRIEVFQDGRNQDDLSAYADEVLAEQTSATVGYGCTASNEDLTPQYGIDYRLGDLVGMKVFGQFVTAEVQQVEINVSDGVETVEPRFGTIAIGKLRSIFQQLAALRRDVNELLGTEIE